MNKYGFDHEIEKPRNQSAAIQKDFVKMLANRDHSIFTKIRVLDFCRTYGNMPARDYKMLKSFIFTVHSGERH